MEWGKRVKGLILTVISFKDELILLAKVLAAVFVVSAIAGWVSATVSGIKTIIIAYNALKASAIVAGIASAFALNPLLGVGAAALAAGVLSAGVALSNKYSTPIPDFGGGKALGGDVMAGTSYLVGERGAELFTPQTNGSITPNSSLGGNVTYNINVTGAIDQESVARQIVTILNNSTARGTQGAANLSYVSGF